MPSDDIILPPRRRRHALKGVPPNLPYVPLGLDGRLLYALDPNSFILRVSRTLINRTIIVSLFGANLELLYELYGRWRHTKEGPVQIPCSIHTERAADDLQRQCASLGRFDALVRLRGLGAWRGEGDDLILHLGDKLWIPAENGRAVEAPLGPRGDFIYPRRGTLPAPYRYPVETDVGLALLEYLGTWHWNRAIDPLLLLGLVGAALVAGALEHRPQVDVTGDAGVGKTGIQLCCQQLLGPRMLLSSDATAAGLRQRIECDALCIGLDEAESGADPRRIADIHQLRRASFGGGETIRGNVDHQAAAMWPLRSIFLSSGITLAAMDGATRSRTAILTLLGPPKGPLKYLPARAEAAMEIVGVKLLRRIADNWGRLYREILPAWRELLEAHGFDGRTSATYGTLLACAWVLSRDTIPAARDYDAFAADLEELVAEDKVERVAPVERLLTHLTSQIVEPSLRSGRRMSIMGKILLAGGWGNSPATYARPEAFAITESKINEDALEAQRELLELGLMITTSDTGARMLAVANSSAWLTEVLHDTPWAPSRGLDEGHVRTLLRAPGARRVQIRRFAARAVAVPLNYVVRHYVGPNPEETSRAWDNIMQGDGVTPDDE